MKPISERLRRGLLDYQSNSGPIYAGPTLQDTEAADTIDALVAALETCRTEICQRYTERYLKEEEDRQFLMDEAKIIPSVAKADAALSLARGDAEGMT